ncbi:MAG: hypothetical protein QOH42_2549 [Blastocatellia bacterium]|nr:hypothetical protein [Blastocatellia bacterium]
MIRAFQCWCNASGYQGSDPFVSEKRFDRPLIAKADKRFDGPLSRARRRKGRSDLKNPEPENESMRAAFDCYKFFRKRVIHS